MATTLGARYLARYAAGQIDVEALAAVLAAGQITQGEYDAATTPADD